MEEQSNRVELVGLIGEEIQRSHQKAGENFAKVILHVRRMSGAIDEIPMIVNETMLSKCGVDKGSRISAKGRVQTHREFDPKRHEYHMRMYVHVTQMEVVSDTEPDKNEVFLSGTICGDTILRRTPSGKVITDFSIINFSRPGKRPYRIWGIAWGRIAYTVNQMQQKDQITFSGRFQSRYYTKVLKNEEKERRIVYEISVTKLNE